jgi:hypothetical protein
MRTVVLDRLRLGFLDDGGPGHRVFGHVDRSAADDSPTASAGAEFRESHFYRHDKHPVKMLMVPDRGKFLNIWQPPLAIHDR